jgi:hypothetical protein
LLCAVVNAPAIFGLPIILVIPLHYCPRFSLGDSRACRIAVVA